MGGMGGRRPAIVQRQCVKGPIQIDIHGGYRGEGTNGLVYDIGVLQHAQVGNKLADTGGGSVYKSARRTEVYRALIFQQQGDRGGWAHQWPGRSTTARASAAGSMAGGIPRSRLKVHLAP